MTDPAAQAPAQAARRSDSFAERFTASVQDAAMAAGIALLLAVPILAYRTEESMVRLDLEARWPLVAQAVAIVFAGRLILNLLPLSSLKEQTGEFFAPIARRLPRIGPVLAVALVAFAAVFPLTQLADRYLLDVGILILTYVMLGWGLNIVVGLAGLLDLGYVAFYAVGAYSFALLAKYFALGFWECLPLAGLVAACWGVLLGFPVLRLRGDYLAIVTLAFGEIIRIVLNNWTNFTGGPNGITDIPRPTLFGIEFRPQGGFAETFGLEYSPLQRIIFLYYIILALALLTNWVTIRLRRMPLGRAWEALREDEIACRALGLNTVTTKLTAFAIGAMFGGVAGAFFATKQGFISPQSFVFHESAIILAIVVLGGMGSQLGVAIAAVGLVGGIELFRDLEIYRMLVFGLAMVLIMVWRPRGLVASRTPSIALEERRVISAELVGQGRG